MIKDDEQKTKLMSLLTSFVLPNKQDFEFGASYGLITLQNFNNFDIRRLANGKKKAEFESRSPLIFELS